jgi:fucose permease
MRGKAEQRSSNIHVAFVIAWVFCLIFYFLQYAIRSAPGVMVPELTSTFGLSALGVSSLIGLYYYTYSTCSIIAGACYDRFGAKYVLPTGIMLLAGGAILFGLALGRRRKLAVYCKARARLSHLPALFIWQPTVFRRAISQLP